MNRSGWVIPAVVTVVLVIAVVTVSRMTSRKSLPPEYVRSIDLPAPTSRIVVTPDQRFLAAAGGTGALSVTEFSGLHRVLADESADGAATLLAVSPDGLLLCGDAGGRVRGWLAPGFQPQSLNGPRVPMTCSLFISDGDDSRIVLGLADGRLVVMHDGEFTLTDSGHPSVKAITLSPNGSEILTAGTDGRIIWRDAETLREKRVAADHNTEISALCWSESGKQLASADWNGSIKVRAADKANLQFELNQPDAVAAMVWNETRLITGSWDGHIRVWDTSPDEPSLIADIDTTRPIHDLVLGIEPDHLLTVSGREAVDEWHIPIP